MLDFGLQRGFLFEKLNPLTNLDGRLRVGGQVLGFVVQLDELLFFVFRIIASCA